MMMIYGDTSASQTCLDHRDIVTNIVARVWARSYLDDDDEGGENGDNCDDGDDDDDGGDDGDYLEDLLDARNKGEAANMKSLSIVAKVNMKLSCEYETFLWIWNFLVNMKLSCGKSKYEALKTSCWIRKSGRFSSSRSLRFSEILDFLTAAQGKCVTPFVFVECLSLFFCPTQSLISEEVAGGFCTSHPFLGPNHHLIALLADPCQSPATQWRTDMYCFTVFTLYT